MLKSKTRVRWVYITIFFLFLLFHQVDLTLLGMLREPIASVFDLERTWFDPVLGIGMVVGLISFIVWGALNDRFNRKNLLVLAGFLWGATSLLMGIAPTYATFFLSNAASGIDNGYTSGIYSMTGDLFSPKNRGKVFGLLLLTQPLGLFLSFFIEAFTQRFSNWRVLLAIAGGVGLLMTLLIGLFLREPKRGSTEPALANIRMTGTYLYDWGTAKVFLFKPSMLLIYALSLLGSIPGVVVVKYLSGYLQDLNGIPLMDVYQILLPALIAYALGFPLGGWVGDTLFKYNKNGRILASMAGALVPAIALLVALQMPVVTEQPFIVLLVLMGLLMSFTWPNLFASIMDTMLPEVRSMATGLMFFFSTIGILIGPLLVNLVSKSIGIRGAILWICTGAWLLCLGCHLILLIFIPKDIEQLRRQIAYRSHLEARFSPYDR